MLTEPTRPDAGIPAGGSHPADTGRSPAGWARPCRSAAASGGIVERSSTLATVVYWPNAAFTPSAPASRLATTATTATTRRSAPRRTRPAMPSAAPANAPATQPRVGTVSSTAEEVEQVAEQPAQEHPDARAEARDRSELGAPAPNGPARWGAARDDDQQPKDGDELDRQGHRAVDDPQREHAHLILSPAADAIRYARPSSPAAGSQPFRSALLQYAETGQGRCTGMLEVSYPTSRRGMKNASTELGQHDRRAHDEHDAERIRSRDALRIRMRREDHPDHRRRH